MKLNRGINLAGAVVGAGKHQIVALLGGVDSVHEGGVALQLPNQLSVLDMITGIKRLRPHPRCPPFCLRWRSTPAFHPSSSIFPAPHSCVLATTRSSRTLRTRPIRIYSNPCPPSPSAAHRGRIAPKTRRPMRSPSITLQSPCDRSVPSWEPSNWMCGAVHPHLPIR